MLCHSPRACDSFFPRVPAVSSSRLVKRSHNGRRLPPSRLVTGHPDKSPLFLSLQLFFFWGISLTGTACHHTTKYLMSPTRLLPILSMILQHLTAHKPINRACNFCWQPRNRFNFSKLNHFLVSSHWRSLICTPSRHLSVSQHLVAWLAAPTLLSLSRSLPNHRKVSSAVCVCPGKTKNTRPTKHLFLTSTLPSDTALLIQPSSLLLPNLVF